MDPRNRDVRDFLSHALLIPMYRAASASESAELSVGASFGGSTTLASPLSSRRRMLRILMIIRPIPRFYVGPAFTRSLAMLPDTAACDVRHD